MENKVDIYVKDGKYMVDATIHTEVTTNDITEVQEHFNVDCVHSFAEAIEDAVNLKHDFRCMNMSIIESGGKL